MRVSSKRLLTALVVAGAAAFGLAATGARANGGSNSIDACIGIVGGCSPGGTGYVLGGAQMYGDQGYGNTYQRPYRAQRPERTYHNGY